MTGWDNCKYPRIFELLKEQKKTAADMARSIGVSKGNITTWKSGTSAPSKAALVAIANYLGTTVKYLKAETDEKTPQLESSGVNDNDDITSFAKMLDDLTDEELKLVADFVYFLRKKRNT